MGKHGMTHCVTANALLALLLVLLIPQHVRCEEPVASSCLIRATLYVTPAQERNAQDFGLPLDIDCGNASEASEASSFDLAAQRVAGKLHVLLNGSQTPPLGVASYGLEYLANCQQLRSAQIERFVGDASLPLSCAGGSPLAELRQLALRHNEFGTLSGSSFALLPQLQRLLLENNSLRWLELGNCSQLLELSVRHERQLALRQSMPLPLEQVQRLELTQLQLIEAPLLAELPAQLAELYVLQTPIVPRQLRIVNGSELLVNLTLAHCELSSFSLTQSPLLQQLNLSGNALRHFALGSSSLRSLDLSGNHLQSLNSSWFAQLPRLRVLLLQHNQLHRVSWLQLLRLAPQSLLQLDLSGNLLLRLEDAQRARWDQTRALRIRIDANPWSCQWLLNFSHAQPQLFRLFSYAKYISHINVNGLSCRPQQEEQEEEQQRQQQQQQQSLIPSRADPHNAHLNVSSHTVLYGNPVEQPHSQRSEALIIVFMLPLGIALLFLLLYLYLHCERLFHWSYYSGGFGCFGGAGSKAARGQRFVDHIDVVRYPVANGSVGVEVEPPQPDGYETPLSGAASICNCALHRQSTCSRTHHVTYEAMPNELPYQLYAEIKEQAELPADEEQVLAETPGSTAPIYDHLTYDEDEKPLEV
ncbi:hypothetical protein KR222_002907 [Zaprionus bogoriensis]|nr:hypothetical protein KR222_002907 [Zaprionus bogoriensis]